MRISDWSAYVCSSDLFAQRVGDPNTGGQTRRPIVTVYRQNALRCAVLLHRQGPTKAALVAAGTGVATAAALLRSDVYGWFERRSEEHTSELQSLMRISYAVLCLKKKTTNRVHTSKNNQHNK